MGLARQEDQYHREGEEASRLRTGAKGIGTAAAMRDKDYKGGGGSGGGGGGSEEDRRREAEGEK